MTTVLLVGIRDASGIDRMGITKRHSAHRVTATHRCQHPRGRASPISVQFNQHPTKWHLSEKGYLVGGGDGWINVEREPEGTVVALCGYTCVDIESTRDGRDYFKPTEGVERGKSFSIKSGNLKRGNLGYRAAADLRYAIGERTLTWST